MNKCFSWACASLLAITVPSGRLVAQEQATVKSDRVNVRGKATLSSEVVTQLKKGETVTVIEEVAVKKPKKGEPSKWVKILLPTNTPVWVNMHFVDPATKTVTARRLNIRSGPGENYSVVGRLEKGAVLKEIRTVDNWMEIEAPERSHGFVAAGYLVKGAAVAAAKPAPVPEPAQPAPPTPTPPVAEPAPTVATVTTPPVPAPAVEPATVPAPVAAPVVVEPPKDEEPPPRRVVRREGIVASTVSIQAPTYFGLESPDNGKLINYIMIPASNSALAGVKLKDLKDFRIVVTGVEYVDKRWPSTPVIEVETLVVAP
jgi:SH3-like domain-containing protein